MNHDRFTWFKHVEQFPAGRVYFLHTLTDGVNHPVRYESRLTIRMRSDRRSQEHIAGPTDPFHPNLPVQIYILESKA